MKNRSLTRIGTSILAGAAILAGSVALAAPANAGGTSTLGGLGKVCIAGASGGTAKVAQTGARPSTPVTYDDAIATQKLTAFGAANEPAFAAQRDLNASAGYTAPAVRTGDRIVWRVALDGNGCAVIPSTGAANSTVTVAYGNLTQTATFKPTFAMVNGEITWTPHTSTSSSKIAASSTPNHGEVVGGRVGFEVNVTP